MERKKSKNVYIQINDEYRLALDGYCMWIDRKRIAEESGAERAERVSGYHYTFTDLIKSLERRNVVKFDGIESLEQLAEKQEQMHEEIRELCRGLKDISELVRDME